MAKKTKIVGGEQLAKRLNEIQKMLGKGVGLEVGFPGGAKYPDGTSVAMVAAVHEYGAPKVGVPPRPFMRPTVRKNSKEWPKALAVALKINGGDSSAALAFMGEVIVGEIKQSIIDVTRPKLKKATVAKKGGRTKPLIDTAQMLDDVTYKVIKKK